MNNIQNLFLRFLDDESNLVDDNEITNFNYFDDLQKDEKKDRLTDIFLLISHITANHHRPPDFYSKIEKLFSPFIEEMKQNLTNDEIYQIFKENRLVLLFLFHKQVLKIDENISKSLPKFFTYEKVQFFSEGLIQLNENIQFEEHDRKRRIGENDNYICQLIRNDSIDDFIIYVNQSNIPLKSQIITSKYETNQYLLFYTCTTLIEYAAFFGSIQIFNYLRMNNVEVNQSLLPFAIYSNNAQMIHLIEECLGCIDCSYIENCIIVSLKCHHNDIANYFLSISQIYDFSVYVIQYSNYSMFDENTYKYLYQYVLSCNDSIVKILLKNPRADLIYNDALVHNFFFFL